MVGVYCQQQHFLKNKTEVSGVPNNLRNFQEKDVFESVSNTNKSKSEVVSGESDFNKKGFKYKYRVFLND